MATNYRYENAEHCVNCRWNLFSYRSKGKKITTATMASVSCLVSGLPAAERELLTAWLPTIENIDERRLCKDCERLLRAGAQAEGEGQARRLGHSAICAACGDSVLRKQSRVADILQPHDRHIFQESLKIPIEDNMKVCMACTRRARRVIEQRNKSEGFEEIKMEPAMYTSVEIEVERLKPNKTMEKETEDMQTEEMEPIVKQLRTGNVPNPEPKAVTPPLQCYLTAELLGGYTKVVEKGGDKCAACDEASSRRLNLPTRQQLLLHKKLYISTGARVCEKHMDAKNWTKIEKVPCDFTGEEIADMIFLLKMIRPVDLGNIEDIHPVILKRWLGVTHEEFWLKLEQKPSLAEQDGGRFALALYLAQQHTGECATVLASLCQRPRGAVHAAIQLAGNNPSSKLEKFLAKV